MGVTQRLGTIPLAIFTDASNNIGIGGSPSGSYKLQVTGASLFTGALRTASTFTSGDTIQLGLASTDGGFWTWGGSNSYLVAATGKALNLNPNGVSGTTGLSIATNGDTTFSRNIVMSGTNAQLLQTTANSVAGDNVMVLYNSNANSYGLYIGAGSGTNHALYCTDSTRTANLFKVQGNGNVGIGTGSPSGILQVSSENSGNTQILLARNYATSATGNFTGNYVAEIRGASNNNISHAMLIHLNENNSGRKILDISSSSGVIMSYASNGAITWSNSAYCICGTNGYRFNNSTDAFNNVIMYDNGNLAVRGALSKGSGSFKIDHPLESMTETHHLVHSFVESPQANNIYRGKVQLINGKAEVNLDEVSTMTEGTFVLLNREIHTYTSNETDWHAVRGNVIGNILHIECQNEESNAIVSWLVIGERQDKHMMDTDWTDENGRVIVEPLKPIKNEEEKFEVSALENKS
jgi:hypothetical protein